MPHVTEPLHENSLKHNKFNFQRIFTKIAGIMHLHKGYKNAPKRFDARQFFKYRIVDFYTILGRIYFGADFDSEEDVLWIYLTVTRT